MVSLSPNEARQVAKSLQAHEREQLRVAGARKFNELKSLKAETLRLLHNKQQRSNGGTPATDFWAVPQLPATILRPGQLGTTTATQPCTTQQQPANSGRDSDTQPGISSAGTQGSNTPSHQGGNSSSGGDNNNGGGGDSSSSMQPPPGATATTAAVPGMASDSHQQEGQAALDNARGVQDLTVDMLLQQLEAVMSEKQQLAAKCSGLERENEQLAELVGHLADSLDEQLEQQQQQQQEGAAGWQMQLESVPEEMELQGEGLVEVPSLAVAGATAAGAGATGAATPGAATPAAAHEHGGLSSTAVTGASHGSNTATSSHSPFTAAAGAGAAGAGAAATGAAAATAAGAGAAGTGALLLEQHKQQRVAEWLEEPHDSSSTTSSDSSSNSSSGSSRDVSAQSWLLWQQQLPLEPRRSASGSSGSSLMISLAVA